MLWLHWFTIFIGYGFVSTSACYVLAKFFFIVVEEFDRFLVRFAHTRRFLWEVIDAMHRPREKRVATKPITK